MINNSQAMRCTAACSTWFTPQRLFKILTLATLVAGNLRQRLRKLQPPKLPLVENFNRGWKFSKGDVPGAAGRAIQRRRLAGGAVAARLGDRRAARSG